MERITGLDEVHVAQLAAYEIAGATERGEDDDIEPDQRRDRVVNENLTAEQRVVCFGSALKVNDDITVWGVPFRVIGPARDRDFFAAYCPDYFGDSLMTINGRDPTDRAPVDPEETPAFPYYPVEEEP